MDPQQRKKLLGIASGELVFAGGIFLAVALRGNTRGDWQLGAAIACFVVAGIFLVVRFVGGGSSKTPQQPAPGQGKGKRSKKKRKH